MRYIWMTGLCLLSMLAGADSPPRQLMTIGMSIASLENPFFVALVKGAEAQAHELNPSVRVTVLANDYVVSRQISHLRRFSEEGVDVILLNAADIKLLKPSITAAKARGIVVVAVDVSAEGADATVQTDNREAGELACAYLAHALKGSGKLIIQGGPPVSSVKDRVAGCHAALKPFPEIKILSDDGDGKGSRWGGMQLMQDQLARFPQVDAVFTINDRQAIGADLAARKAGRSKLIISSVDGAPDIEQALKADTLIQASASQNPYAMARRAVVVANDILQGRRPANPLILLHSRLVTRDNVAEYRGWADTQP